MVTESPDEVTIMYDGADVTLGGKYGIDEGNRVGFVLSDVGFTLGKKLGIIDGDGVRFEFGRILGRLEP